MPQYSQACLGNPLLEAPQGLPIDSVQSEVILRQATVNGSGGHYGCNGVNSCEMTVGVSGAWRGGFNQPEALAAAVWGDESEAAEDCWGV